MTSQDRIKVRDAGAMRALAHPLRLQILGALRAGGPSTVGRLSEQFDSQVGSISYHLQTLSKHGFVAEAPELATDKRERWWKAAHSVTEWDREDFRDDPQGQAANAVLRRAVLEEYHTELTAALDSETTLDWEWASASDSSDSFSNLTLEEFRELNAELASLHERWSQRSHEAGAATKPVRLITHLFIHPDA